MRGFGDEPVWRQHSLLMREYDVLYTLSKCDAPARMGELSQGVLLSQPALSRLVDRLEARGLVERVADPEDGRAVRVGLTPAGSELQRAVGRTHARSVAKAMRTLDPAEQRELERLTRKLVGE
jgi:DNA-binding MarR family transcriptional regulator